MLLWGPRLTAKHSQLAAWAPAEAPEAASGLGPLKNTGRRNSLQRIGGLGRIFKIKHPLKGQILCHMTQRAQPIISALAQVTQGKAPLLLNHAVGSCCPASPPPESPSKKQPPPTHSRLLVRPGPEEQEGRGYPRAAAETAARVGTALLGSRRLGHPPRRNQTSQD